jgi:hypothetical protein
VALLEVVGEEVGLVAEYVEMVMVWVLRVTRRAWSLGE